MYVIADQFGLTVCVICCRNDRSRCAVVDRVHRIVQMCHMGDTCFDRCFCCLIICRCVRDRQHDFSFFRPDKFHRTFFFRCQIYQFEQTSCCFLQPFKHCHIRFVDVFSVLCPFFCHGDKRAFHIDSAENRTFFIFMGFRRFRDPCQPLLIKRHGCRCDRCHALAGLIICHYLNGLFRSVTEILSHTAMKMNICQSRNQITAAAVDYCFSVFAGLCKIFALYTDFFFFKYAFFGINLCAPDDHCSSPPSSFS